MKAFRWAEPLLWMALGGLVVWLYGLAMNTKADTAVAGTVTAEQRQARALAVISKGPETRMTATTMGDIIEVDIPQKTPLGLVELQRCVVWRDHGNKTSSLSCSAERQLQIPVSSTPP